MTKKWLLLGMLVAAAPAQAATVIKLGHGANENFHMSRAMVEFERLVEEGSDGEIDVQIFPSSQMGPDRAMIEGVQTGILEMAVSPSSFFNNWDPAFGVVELAYIYPDKDTALDVLDGPEGDALLERLDRLGLKGLGWVESGMRHLTNNVRPIGSPEDLDGIKLRTMKVPAHVDTFKALGANPTPMNFGEVYSALQQGVIDGQENPLSLIDTQRFHEVQKYLTLSGHIFTVYTPVISKAFFESLPEDQQQLIQQSMDQAIAYDRELVAAEDADHLARIQEQGVEVSELSDEQYQAFAAIAEDVNAQYRERIGADVFDGWMAAIDSAAAQ
ncbi:MAG: TRAP transporter substrate-binding protein [Gammaproteobacteria bacterium]|uniref:TRAP transporter substrate-binding protein n=1 Tax=unclassified Halomonas TaxID=2609666 RepID=UPI000D331DD9|nr:TRAP transporter substrate-binding protein [Halomonas sp. BN3-1]MBR9881371.1 TRAP transporter substrate-binding protein [Gammaproteobacteria bacterium]